MTSPEGDVNIVGLSLHVYSKRLSSTPFNVMRSVLESDKPKLHSRHPHMGCLRDGYAYLHPFHPTNLLDSSSHHQWRRRKSLIFSRHVTHRAAIRSTFSGCSAGAFQKSYSSLYALVSSPLTAPLAETRYSPEPNHSRSYNTSYQSSCVMWSFS
jgi:hypothetical protein